MCIFFAHKNGARNKKAGIHAANNTKKIIIIQTI